jgi:2-polyprenyl-3-methyl-5-hydroxy-6-metoxy-1,4-benzoquinol methylase
MDKSYYREYFDIERNHWWFRARSRILQNYILKNISGGEPLRILNVGVATGATSVMLQHFGEVVSIEYEQECIDFIKDKVSFQVIQGSILELSFADHTFDLVCAFDVIEHVEDHALAVRELQRVCKPDGSVLVTVPAGMNLWSEHDEINHHFRRYSLNQLRSVFSSSGEIAFSTYFNFWLYLPILFARKISNWFRDKKKGQLQSDFEKFKMGITGMLLFNLLQSESWFISRKISLPRGVSALLHWRKLK